MSAPFDTDLLLRVEEAGVNASAPREQLWVDGWLLRFSPGKAKRARCIQAVAPGRLSVQARLDRCLALYAKHALRPYVRITPFSQPPGLDALLAARGMTRIGDTRVMVATLTATIGGAAIDTPPDTEWRFASATSADFAEWVGAQRGSPGPERTAHALRLRDAPVQHHAVLVTDANGETVAGGQVALEDDLAGLYDIFTAAAARQRGLGLMLCGHLLAHAAREGARIAYLQVEAENESACRIYRRLGFEEAYSYHYRTPPAS
jgi:ribosomal protein S18 acetylase RimI-like enzyme